MNLLLRFVAPFVAIVAAPSSIHAQHLDVLWQQRDARLTAGSADFDSGAWTLGRRVFAAEFDSDYAINSPGFNALAVGSGAMPAQASALPGSTPLEWDFLPMKIDGVVSNLFYWNGMNPSVLDFGPLPGSDYSLALFGRNEPAAVDGGSELVPGDVIDVTAPNGSIHAHRFVFLDSGNANATTSPADGIYLASMRARMAGVDRSAPIYFVFGTPGSSLAALAAAEAWTVDRANQLAPDFAADFDGDLDVDGADFVIWQRNLGGAGGARHALGDADRDHATTAADLLAWRSEFGSSLATFAGAGALTPAGIAAPEPDAAAHALVAAAVGLAIGRRRPPKRTAPTWVARSPLGSGIAFW